MNVQEVIQISRNRKLRNKDSVNKIIHNIHKKIKNYALLKHDSCTYIIPPIIEETPLYDLENVIQDVFKILDNEGYICTAYSNGQIDISWNEKLVEQKVKTDSYILNQQEQRLRNITKKNKNIDKRFEFIANPSKTTKMEKSIDQQLDEQIEKILKEKTKEQKKYSKLLT
uniref:Uncharacterized protein n=1 Tax=viral metagenome TaxID=1070528 RepID=A0A6C0I9K0_9ZZZZ